jgi:Xaa-Pro aminopeptidase
MNKPDFVQRRKKLYTAMKEGVLLLIGTPEPTGLGGAGKFYQNRDLLYYTGFPEPSAAALFKPGSGKPFTLFVQPRDPAAETWTGKRHGVEGAVEVFGADQAFPTEQWPEKLYEALVNEKTLYYRWGEYEAADAVVMQVLQRLRREQRADKNPIRVVDSGEATFPIRLIKEPGEVELIRQSAAIADKAIRRIFAETKPGMMEYQVEAMVEETYRFNGADGPSFPTIIAAGEHGTCMHYAENSGPIKPGDFLLVDTGCLYAGYACDVTRTFLPGGGKPTPRQKTIWDAVKEIQAAMLSRCRTNISLCELNQLCQRVTAQKLIELGFLKESLDTVLEKNLHKYYFPHRLGHWLGLDVHDVGSWGMEDASLKFAPGMALTIEPGIYIPSDCPPEAKAFAGIGVRLEEDVVITTGDPDILTKDIPYTP